ncbi:hypothetical protein [Rhodopila sp.]|uniref:hypothetical protein n=1 Tax=Rhodopila sp. TaxID=2480087 RepID=UPI003D0BF881
MNIQAERASAGRHIRQQGERRVNNANFVMIWKCIKTNATTIEFAEFHAQRQSVKSISVLQPGAV